jgi:hypothetical protein
MMTIGKKEKIQIAVTLLLLPVLIFLFLPKPGKGKGSAANFPIPQIAGKQGVLPKAGNKERQFDLLAHETEKYGLKKDPFLGVPIFVVKAAEEMLLMGIAWDPERPSAIINNRIVNVGSQIEDKTVTYIGKDRVILSDGERNYELLLEL